MTYPLDALLKVATFVQGLKAVGDALLEGVLHPHQLDTLGLDGVHGVVLALDQLCADDSQFLRLLQLVLWKGMEEIMSGKELECERRERN